MENTEEEPRVEKTKEETDKKCDSCGGVMDFDPATGKLVCPYCGSSKEIKTDESKPASAQEALLTFENPEETGNCDWGAEKKSIICKSCGAESVYDALQIANVCPYCDSNQVMEEKGKKTLAPGGVCTFAVTHEQAGDNFKKWIKGSFFCPSEAKKKAKPDAFKGVYIPYWTYDTDTYSTFKGEYGIDKTTEDSDGNKHTDTDWFPTSGDHREFIDDQPVCATTRYDLKILKQLEPFNTNDNKSYKPEYVAGYIAERYTIGLKDGWTKAKEFIHERLKGNIEKGITSRHNADHVRNLIVDTNYSNMMYKYLLFPVWLSSFKYKDKIYNFMINGQTGKVSGNLPIDPLKVALVVLVIIIIIVTLCSLGGQ